MTVTPIRRVPAAFRAATVGAIRARSDRLLRFTLTGAALAGFDIGLPASSVRLLTPRDDAVQVEIPIWNGNEFLYGDGIRPAIRTLTPLTFDPDANALDVEIVLHGAGPMSTWAAGASVGDPVAVAGTGRGYTVDDRARSFLLLGDESALPAISLLVAALPPAATAVVLIEIAEPTAQIDLAAHPGTELRWVPALPDGGRSGDALVEAAAGIELDDDVRIWAAGEAAAMQRLRLLLLEDRQVPRSRAVIRGYWKHARDGGEPGGSTAGPDGI